MAQPTTSRITSLPTPTAYRQASLAQTPAQAGYLDGPLTFRLDPDIRMACIDQAQACGVEFNEWLQQTVNDCLRSNFGL